MRKFRLPREHECKFFKMPIGLLFFLNLKTKSNPCKRSIRYLCPVVFVFHPLPDCFQQGLVERQIVEVLHGLHKSRTPQQPDSSVSAEQMPDLDQEDGSILQKGIQAQDVCPICQEELLEKLLPVCYCRSV